MTSPGVISAAELYTLPEAQSRLRLGRHTFRDLQKAGLQILIIGRCHFVSGAELIKLIQKIGSAQEVS